MAMEVIEEKIDDLNAVLKVKLTRDDYGSKYDDSLKNYRKNVSLPGFRPGHVPMGLIKRKYGPSILAEEMNKIINESLNNHIRENELNILGNPIPKEGEKAGDWDNPADFVFSYEIGLAPDFKLKISGKDKFNYYIIKPDKEMLDKEVENMRRRYGSLTGVEESDDKDMILGQFVELNEDGTPKDGGIIHTSTVSLEFLDSDKAKKQLKGLKVGDTVKLDPKDVSKGDTDTAAMLGIAVADLPNVSNSFNFTVTEIKRMNLAEMNQEFFDKIFGEGEVTSEKELRDRISNDLIRMFQSDSDRMFQRDISEQMVEKLKLPLPDDFLKRWIQMSNEKPVTFEQIEDEYESYSNGLRWQLIENKIIKENDIKVEYEEVLNHTKGLIANNFAQYGMPAPPDDELKKNAESVLQNQDEARRIYQSLYDVKIMQFLKENVKVVEKEVSYDEFLKLASKQG